NMRPPRHSIVQIESCHYDIDPYHRFVIAFQMVIILDEIERNKVQDGRKGYLQYRPNSRRYIIRPQKRYEIVCKKKPPEFRRIFPGTPLFCGRKLLPADQTRYDREHSAKQF